MNLIESEMISKFDLTFKQAKVAVMASDGLTNKEIASRLGISEQAIKYHISKVLKSCAVRGRKDLVKIVLKLRSKL